MIRVSLQPAFILHHRPYRDTSLLLEVFTRDYGRISLVARGVKQRNNGDKSLLQPFVPVLLSYGGRGELLNMNAVEQSGGSIVLKSKALFSAIYINELLLRLLHRNDPHESLFGFYRESLLMLSQKRDMELEPALRRFETVLLAELGYGLSLETDALTGDALQPDDQYFYDIERGPIKRQHAVVDAGPVVSGRCLLSLAANQFDIPDCGHEMKLLMRHVLAHYLNGKPIKSRELFL